MIAVKEKVKYSLLKHFKKDSFFISIKTRSVQYIAKDTWPHNYMEISHVSIIACKYYQAQHLFSVGEVLYWMAAF